MDERRFRQIFRIGVLLKGAHALLECASGAALYFVSTDTIVNFVYLITQDGPLSDPNDYIATRLLSFAQNFSIGSKEFYVFYLLSHGLIKVLLVAGLIRNKLWSYPVSLVVLGLFILYQVYRYSFTQSPLLLILTVFDVVVIGLIWHEYQLVRRMPGHASASRPKPV